MFQVEFSTSSPFFAIIQLSFQSQPTHGACSPDNDDFTNFILLLAQPQIENFKSTYYLFSIPPPNGSLKIQFFKIVSPHSVKSWIYFSSTDRIPVIKLRFWAVKIIRQSSAPATLPPSPLTITDHEKMPESTK